MKKERENHALVLDCLEEAVIKLLSKKKIENISISELCETAGVSRVSFYRNYNKVEDILINALSRKTDRWWEEYRLRNNGRYDDFLKELFSEYKKSEEFITLIYRQDLMHIIKKHIFSCCEVSSQANDTFAYYQRSMFAGCIYGITEAWIKNGMKEYNDMYSIRNLIGDSYKQK